MENLLHLTDEELILRFRNQGNNDAFDTLLKRYGSPLYTYIYIILRNKEIAEDISHDTWLKVIVNVRLGKYQESGKFPNWVTRIAHNCMTDYFRREQRDSISTSTDSFPKDIFNSTHYSEETVEDKMVQKQILLNVRRMVRQLPEAQQEIVKLRYYKGLSFKDIAKLTGVSLNTALGRMHYAVLNMRRMIKKHQSLVSI